jgi:uncharacterized protein YecE (DUF72 family)
VKAVHVGCSGWNYADWRGTVYPKGCPPRRWLAHYATLFDTVEVNSTFYRLASRDAVRGWVDQTPDRFVFALKASRYLTHLKRLADMDRGVRRFYERIDPLVGTPKLGPIVWQLPESFRRDDERLAFSVEHLPPGRHCFELRHESWFVPEVYALLRAHDVALVVADTAGRFPSLEDVTAGFVYVRLHGDTELYVSGYTPDALDRWAQRVREWLAGGSPVGEHTVAPPAPRTPRDVYVYFDNDAKVHAPYDAIALAERVG